MNRNVKVKKHTLGLDASFRRERARRRRRLRIELLEARRLLAAGDYGDAPLPYPVTLAEDGARHTDVGPRLGATRDNETDGTHSAAADADGADEDGVTFGTIQIGKLDATAMVNVQNAPSGAKLDAWIDFNADGNWSGPYDRIAANVAVVNGENTISFDVPSYSVAGTTYARFRLSTAGDLGIGGMATDGEVEDYQIPMHKNSGKGTTFQQEDDHIVKHIKRDPIIVTLVEKGVSHASGTFRYQE